MIIKKGHTKEIELFFKHAKEFKKLITKEQMILCTHTLTEMLPDPDGNVPIERCIICGKEILK